MNRLEKMKALLDREPHSLEMGVMVKELAVLVDYYETVGREPESIWDRDFRALAATIPFDPDGDDAEDCRLLDMVAGITNRMQDIRSRRKKS